MWRNIQIRFLNEGAGLPTQDRQPGVFPVPRIKAKYNPIPTKREREYHLWLMSEYPCACGCGERSTVVHHPLTRHPEQRWRRDHEFVVPMTDHCHQALHAMGRESLFSVVDFAELAWWFRGAAIEGYKL